MSGRLAIDEALERLYPTEKDFRFGLFPEANERSAPLAEIVAFRASKPAPHWHYVTYGLSELDGKNSSDPKLSGFGIEYTLRLVADEDEPPYWPMNLLRWLAKLVTETREPLDPKHSMNVPGRLLEQVFPGVEGLAGIEDSELGTIETANGSLTFVGVIPLVEREHWLLGAWDFDKYVHAISTQHGDLLWRAGRPSVLEGSRGEELLARVERDGSSQSMDFIDFAWTEREVVLDPASVDVVVKFLRYRIAYGRDATIVSGERRAKLSCGNWRMECSSATCALVIPSSEAAPLAEALWAAERGSVVERPGGVRFRIDGAA